MFKQRTNRSAAALLAACLLAGLAAPAAAASLAPERNYADICLKVAHRLPAEHLLRMPLDDQISRRAWTNFFATLDPDRVFFTQADVHRFRPADTQLDDQLKAGEMDFAFDVFDVFKTRVSNRVDYVGTLLEQGFDLATEETYRWRRDDAPWAAGLEDWNALWRKRIQNEYVRLLVGREIDAARAAAATNAAAAPPPEDGGATNAAALSPDAAAPADAAATNRTTVAVQPERTPEETILRRYRQTLSFFMDIDPEWVLQNYLTAFAQAYDPHSSYLPRSALEDFKIEMKLSLVGIGAVLSSQEGAAEIVRLIPGGPAERDTRDRRLLPGDRIVAVSQGDEEAVDILHWPLHRVVQLIRGEVGTRVVLTVIPASDPTGAAVKMVDLIRDEVKLEQQAANSRVRTVKGDDGLARKLGVIRLPAFYGNMQVESPDAPGFRSAVYDVRNLLWEMQKQQAEGVLLDLRGNGGGALDEAVDMTGLFVRRGPAARVKSRYGVRTLYDSDPTVSYTGPLVVLVNRLSASAAEILAGALQDYGRAIIVGDSKTHGKGTVQGLLPVSGDSETLGALKVTNAVWYRISGAPTQLRGVTPDIVVPSPWDFIETGERFLRYPLPWSDVRAAPYRPVGDLEAVLPRLRERSERRRQNDANFQTYAGLLERIGVMNRAGELPLNLIERRRIAEIEQELTELQDRLTLAMQGDENESDAGDLVLNEGLTILADLVSLHRDVDFADSLDGSGEQQKYSLIEWLRDNL